MLDFTKIKEHKHNITSRIIKKPVFVPTAPINLDLHKPVIVYSDGINHKVIPLDVMLRYPVVYDTYTDNNVKFPITVSVCPFTLSSNIYFGVYKLTNQTYFDNIILQDTKDLNLIAVQMFGQLYSWENKNIITDKIIRRKEVKIMLLRNVITKYPDCLYLSFNYNKAKSLINNINLENTLSYIIEYKSKDVTQTNYKYTLITTKNKSHSFDYILSNYDKYFEFVVDDVRDKLGFITPCLLKSWIKIKIKLNTTPKIKSKIIKV